jgi:tryptophan halogenase
MDLWRRSARIAKYSQGLFFEPSWVAVYVGQGVMPDSWDERADVPGPAELDAAIERVRRQVADRVAIMPSQAEFISVRNALIEAPA